MNDPAKTILRQAVFIIILIVIVFVLVAIIYFQHLYIHTLEGQYDYWYRECLELLENA